MVQRRTVNAVVVCSNHTSRTERESTSDIPAGIYKIIIATYIVKEAKTTVNLLCSDSPGAVPGVATIIFIGTVDQPAESTA